MSSSRPPTSTRPNHDIAAATAKAKSLGATVFREVTVIPNTGSFSIIVDPTGAMLALWEPAKK